MGPSIGRHEFSKVQRSAGQGAVSAPHYHTRRGPMIYLLRFCHQTVRRANSKPLCYVSTRAVTPYIRCLREWAAASLWFPEELGTFLVNLHCQCIRHDEICLRLLPLMLVLRLLYEARVVTRII
jgi:hypothetical protein